METEQTKTKCMPCNHSGTGESPSWEESLSCTKSKASLDSFLAVGGKLEGCYNRFMIPDFKFNI